MATSEIACGLLALSVVFGLMLARLRRNYMIHLGTLALLERELLPDGDVRPNERLTRELKPWSMADLPASIWLSQLYYAVFILGGSFAVYKLMKIN